MAKIQLPSVEDIDVLPRWAIVALAARCARRLQASSQQCGKTNSDQDAIANAIAVAEQSAASGIPEQVDEAIRAAKAIANRITQEGFGAGDATEWIAEDCAPASAAAYAAATVQNSGRSRAQSAYWAMHGVAYVHEHDSAIPDGMRRDYDLLRESATKEDWNNDSPVPPAFFALHTEFEEKAIQLFNDKIGVEADAKLIEYCTRHPHLLYSLTPRQFEEVIAVWSWIRCRSHTAHA